jgi:hypothetical protein
MATVKAANVTKYEAGGGDNTIADGFIKTVEKVWIDTYSLAAVIPTTTSILIGKIPAGKKLTDLKVYIPVISGVATTSTCYLDTAATTSVSSWGGALMPLGSGSYAFASATESVLRLGTTKALQEMPVDVDLYLMIAPATTITGGTLRTIIKYT